MLNIREILADRGRVQETLLAIEAGARPPAAKTEQASGGELHPRTK